MKRVITYARASTARQENSVQDQQVITRRYVAEKRYQLVDELSDVGSGRATKKRPGYLRLKKAIEERRCDIVLVHDVSRLSRNMRHLLTMFEFAKQRNVLIFAVNIGEITQFHIASLGLVAQMQIEVGVDQIRRAHQANILEGLRAGKSLYGYRADTVDGQKGHLKQHKEEADVVRRAFGLAADGLALPEIASIFNAEEIPAPGGGFWRTSTLSRVTIDAGDKFWDAPRDDPDAEPRTGRRRELRIGILHNTAYYGTNTYGRTRQLKDVDTEALLVHVNDRDTWLEHPGRHEPIISRELFDRVQAVRADFANRNVKIKGGPTRLLSGLIRCETCGGSMIRMGRGRDPSTARIICTNGIFKQGCDNGRTYYVDRIEALTIRVLTSFLEGDTACVQEYLDRHAAERRIAMRTGRSDIQKLKATVDQSRVGVRNLIEALKLGGDPNVLNPEISQLNREISRNEALLAEALSTGVTFKVDPATLASLRQELSRLGPRLAAANPEPADKEMIARFRALIDRVVPKSPGKWKNGFTIEVYGRLSQIVSGSLDPLLLSSSMLQSSDRYQMENARTLAHATILNARALIGRAQSATCGNLEALGIHGLIVAVLEASEHPQDMSQLVEHLDKHEVLKRSGVSSERLQIHIRKTPNVVLLGEFGYWMKTRPYPMLGYDPNDPKTARVRTRGPLVVRRSPGEAAAVAEIRRIMIERQMPMKVTEIIGALSSKGLFSDFHDPFVAMPSLLRRNKETFISLRKSRYWPSDADNILYSYKASYGASHIGGNAEAYLDSILFRDAVAKLLEVLRRPIETGDLHVALTWHGYRRRSSKALKQRAEASGLLRQLEDGRWWHAQKPLPASA